MATNVKRYNFPAEFKKIKIYSPEQRAFFKEYTDTQKHIVDTYDPDSYNIDNQDLMLWCSAKSFLMLNDYEQNLLIAYLFFRGYTIARKMKVSAVRFYDTINTIKTKLQKNARDYYDTFND